MAKSFLSTESIEYRVSALIEKMTLEEKIGQLNLINSDYGTVSSITRKALQSGVVSGILNEVDSKTINELQRIAIAKCLTAEADIYLLDEPSAFLDVEMRLQVAQLLRKSIEELKKSAFVVEHDIITQDFIADSILVFEGLPGIEGYASAPLDLRDGFNKFLKMMNITFRRDNLTKRPRVNKTGSNKDSYQKSINEYYYIPKHSD